MRYIMQKEPPGEDIDVLILRQRLITEPYLHTFVQFSLRELEWMDDGTLSRYADYCPVGTLKFVGLFLKRVHGITNMSPIEVPEVLRRPEFLGREYHIVGRDGLPKSGTWFVKDAGHLKSFSNRDMRDIKNFRSALPPGTYQYSSPLNIKAEYRIFVHHESVRSVAWYDGDPCVFPDMAKVRAMTGAYTKDDARPKAYTLDVAVTDDGTFLLEVHPWVSVGLYSYLWGTNLAYCYSDGISWYIVHNTPVTLTN